MHTSAISRSNVIALFSFSLSIVSTVIFAFTFPAGILLILNPIVLSAFLAPPLCLCVAAVIADAHRHPVVGLALACSAGVLAALSMLPHYVAYFLTLIGNMISA